MTYKQTSFMMRLKTYILVPYIARAPTDFFFKTYILILNGYILNVVYLMNDSINALVVNCFVFFRNNQSQFLDCNLEYNINYFKGCNGHHFN